MDSLEMWGRVEFQEFDALLENHKFFVVAFQF